MWLQLAWSANAKISSKSERAICDFGRASNESPMNSLERYVLALSRVLVATIFLQNGLGIISQAAAAKELLEHGAPANLVPFLMLSSRTIEVVSGFCLALGIRKILATKTPLGVPWIEPGDVAPVVVFLASDAAHMVSGATYDVTGGDSAHNTA
jgi:Enoyl-(Acyl carrier protein) reductase